LAREHLSPPSVCEPPTKASSIQGETTWRPQPRAKTRRTRRTGTRDPLAIRLLKADHREVDAWFEEYEQLEEADEKVALFNKIALALKVHTQIEEEIFYPEERGDVEDDLMDEAYVEHDGAKKLIAEIEAMTPDEEFYDAKVKVLGEYIKHHVKEEEQPGGMFAQAKKGDEDLDAMGERLQGPQGRADGRARQQPN
jgi:hemerythrin superfamily protein